MIVTLNSPSFPLTSDTSLEIITCFSSCNHALFRRTFCSINQIHALPFLSSPAFFPACIRIPSPESTTKQLLPPSHLLWWQSDALRCLKPIFSFVLEGSNSTTVTLETTITHCLQNKQWYLFSQRKAGRARGSQAILGLTGVLTYCIHSLRQKIVQHKKQGTLKVRAFGWKPQTSAQGSEGQASLPSQQWGLFLSFFHLPSCSPLSCTQRDEKRTYLNWSYPQKVKCSASK